MSYVAVSYKLFGNTVEKFGPQFKDLYDELKKANLTYTMNEYVSMAIFTTILVFVMESAAFAFVFGLFTDIITAVLLSLTLSITISLLLFFLFYTYPSALANSRNNRIKKILPFATAYMTSIASSRLPPLHVFKTLAKFSEYGEVSKEAKNIVNDVELLGMNFSTALKHRAKISPCREFAEMLWGINSAISSGGDLPRYLKDKTDEFMEDYRRRIRKYSQDLSVYVEIYMTLIMTGSIFFIVLSSTMSLISGGLGTAALQTFIVLILLPLLSIGFILMIKGLSPEE